MDKHEEINDKRKKTAKLTRNEFFDILKKTTAPLPKSSNQEKPKKGNG